MSFFITITNKVNRNKMIEMYFRTFKIKILFVIFIKPPLYCEIRGRHPTLNIPGSLYIIEKTGANEQNKKLGLIYTPIF